MIENNFEIYLKKLNCIKKTPPWIQPDSYDVLFPDLPKELKEQQCLIQKFFEDQKKLPIHQRKNYCHISCNCPKCMVWC